MPCKLTEFPAPSFPSHCIANLLLFIIFFFLGSVASSSPPSQNTTSSPTNYSAVELRKFYQLWQYFVGILKLKHQYPFQVDLLLTRDGFFFFFENLSIKFIDM
jgi:hypothetical protein